MLMQLMLVAILAAPPADTATTSYEVAGIRVIHRPLAANEIVAVNLYLLGGSRQLTPELAGVEGMLLRVSEFGTQGYPGREARLALARTGSRTVLSTDSDWTLFGFRGIRTEFDSTWNVFADRVMRPALDSAGLEVVRRRMLRSARSRRVQPDDMLRVLADSVAFNGHPYAHDTEGTEGSIQALTADVLRAWHQAEMVKSRMLLVVVGNIPRAQIEAVVNRTLANLPVGSYAWSLPPEWTAAQAAITSLNRRLPTNYILGWFAGPRSDSPDYAAFRVATMILGGIASNEIRDAGLSYAAYAPFLERGASGGGIYVTTTRPDTTMKIFNATIEFLRDNTVNRSILQRYYDGFITNYYSENESNAGQADFLARYQLLHGDWQRAALYMEDLKRVQGTHIRSAVRKYMRNIQYVYIGNTAWIPEREMKEF